MKTRTTTLLYTSLATFFFFGLALAADTERMVFKLKTNDFEIAETDVSALAVGEAKTIVTESGKTVDILRTSNGLEVYVDGELLHAPILHEADHTATTQHWEIECVSDGTNGAEDECGADMVFLADADIDVEGLHTDGAPRHVIVKHLEFVCADDQEGECEDEQVWVSDGSDVEFGELHEAHDGEHKLIRVKKTSHDASENESVDEKVIVIKK